MRKCIFMVLMIATIGCSDHVKVEAKSEAEKATEKSDRLLKEFKKKENEFQDRLNRIDSLKDQLNKSEQNK